MECSSGTDSSSDNHHLSTKQQAQTHHLTASQRAASRHHDRRRFRDRRWRSQWSDQEQRKTSCLFIGLQQQERQPEMKWLFTINQTSRQAFSWCQKSHHRTARKYSCGLFCLSQRPQHFPFCSKKANQPYRRPKTSLVEISLHSSAGSVDVVAIVSWLLLRVG